MIFAASDRRRRPPRARGNSSARAAKYLADSGSDEYGPVRYARLARAQLDAGDVAAAVATAYHAAKLGHARFLHRDLRDYDDVREAARKPRVSLQV